MSDTPEGVGWWRASDGKWYPPEQRQPREPAESESVENEPAATPTTADASGTAEAAPIEAPAVPGEVAATATPWWKSPRVLAIAAVVALLCGIGIGFLLASADSDDEAGTVAEEAEDAPTEAAAEAPTETVTEAATEAPTATPTATPTGTPTEAATEAPTESSTGTELEFSGNGSDVVAIDPPLEGDPLLITMEHSGPSNFIVEGLDEFDEITGFYANAIDAWWGTVPMNWLPGDTVTKLMIDAGGDWHIAIADRSEAPVGPTNPGDVYEGSGAEVLRFVADEATSTVFDCPNCAAAVVIIAHGEDLLETLVEEVEVDGFEAALELPEGTEFLEVGVGAELRLLPPDWTLRVE